MPCGEISKEKETKIVELTESDKFTRKEIAEKVDCSKSTVYSYQKKHNLL